MHKYSKGFTILELVVVIAIIAILAMVVTFHTVESIYLAKETSIKADMQQLATAAAEYSAGNNQSGFCKSPGNSALAKSIIKEGSNYNFYCSNGPQTSGGGTQPMATGAAVIGGTGSADGGSSSNGIILNSINNNCPQGQWYAYTCGLKNTSGCWCVDSKGNAKDSKGSASTCSCN